MLQPKILITDDHSMIRKGLKLYLQLNLGMPEIEESVSCETLLKSLKGNYFTHLILDIILSDGNTLEIIPTIRNLYPELSIMIFSMQPTEVYGEALKQYGIEYYLSKTAGEQEILSMLNKFIHNEPYIQKQENSIHQKNPFTALTHRELEVLHYLLKGYGTKNISTSLNVKMNTISTLKNRILDKTSCTNIKELMELATLYNVNS